MSQPPKTAPTGFSLSFKPKTGLKSKSKPLTNAPSKRPNALFDDDEPRDTIKSEEISGWDTTAGGAIDVHGVGKVEKPLDVIAPQPNRDWREAARKKHSAQANEVERRRADEAEMKEGESVTYGLTILKGKEEEGEGEKMDIDGEEAKPAEPLDDGLTEEERLEKRALAALTNGEVANTHEVIPMGLDEEEVFEHDYQNAPDAPSLDDYEARPIEGFGAALLRGMGWKDGEEIGRNKKAGNKKQKEVKRRPALLGIGAKDAAAAGIEIGAWGKGKGGKQLTYNPIVYKNKTTGEKLSEEELQAQLQKQESAKDSEKWRNDKYELEFGDEDDEERRRGRKSKDRRDTDKYGERREGEKSRRRDDDRRDRDRGDDRRDRDRTSYRDEKPRDRERERDRPRDDEKRELSYRSRDRDERPKDRKYDDERSDRKRDHRRTYEYSDDERRREKGRDRERDRDQRRSKSPDSDERRKRRREYDDEREDRSKRQYKEDRYRK